MHSKYNPIAEAEQFIDSLEDILFSDIIIFIGIGLGYHIKEVDNRVKNSKFIIFEFDDEIININNKYNTLKDIRNNKVEIISSKNKNSIKILSKYLEEVEDIIIHKPSLDLIKDYDINLYEILNDFSISKESINAQKYYLEKNEENNLKTSYKEIEECFNIFDKNKPFLIIAAGPSLDFDLKFISENKLKYNIISVGTALRALLEYKIKPNIIVIIDRKKVVKKQLECYSEKDIPLAFLSTASRWAVEYHKGEKFIFYNDEERDVFIRTGKTVAVAATDIAIKCGAKKIIFVGQDLAHLNGKTHTNTFEKIYGYKDVAYKLKDYREIMGVDENILETREGFLYFKKQLEILIESNPSIEFYNSSKGAKIIGTKSINIKEVRF